jgi:hypothetical protein
MSFAAIKKAISSVNVKIFEPTSENTLWQTHGPYETKSGHLKRYLHVYHVSCEPNQAGSIPVSRIESGRCCCWDNQTKAVWHPKACCCVSNLRLAFLYAHASGLPKKQLCSIIISFIREDKQSWPDFTHSRIFHAWTNLNYQFGFSFLFWWSKWESAFLALTSLGDTSPYALVNSWAGWIENLLFIPFISPLGLSSDIKAFVIKYTTRLFQIPPVFGMLARICIVRAWIVGSRYFVATKKANGIMPRSLKQYFVNCVFCLRAMEIISSRPLTIPKNLKAWFAKLLSSCQA